MDRLTPEQSAEVARYWPVVASIARWWLPALGGDEGAVMDAANDGLIQAIVSPKLDPGRTPLPYIRCVVACRIIDAMRKAKRERRRHTVSMELVGDLCPGPGPDPDPEGWEDAPAPCLAALMDRLTPRQRDLVARHFGAGEPYPSIGRSYGINHQVARRQTLDAIRIMREVVANHVPV